MPTNEARRSRLKALRAAATEAGTLRAERNRLRAVNAELVAALETIEAKANHAKDNPRIQTDKLFDILESARAVLARARE